MFFEFRRHLVGGVRFGSRFRRGDEDDHHLVETILFLEPVQIDEDPLESESRVGEVDLVVKPFEAADRRPAVEENPRLDATVDLLQVILHRLEEFDGEATVVSSDLAGGGDERLIADLVSTEDQRFQRRKLHAIEDGAAADQSRWGDGLSLKGRESAGECR